MFGALVEPSQVWAEEAPAPGQKPAAKPYPFDTCLVSGESLVGSGDMVVEYVYEGQQLKFSNRGSLKRFLKEPAKYMEKFANDVRSIRPPEKLKSP